MADPEGTPGIDGVDLFMRDHDWPPYPGSRGQCMDCGFFSRRSSDPGVFAVEEVSIEQRKRGDVFALKASAGPSIPWCYVRPSAEVDLFREAETEGAREREEARAKGTPDFVQVSIPELLVGHVLAADRKCPEWYWYTPGLSPAEHRAERNMLRLEGDRAALQVRLAEMESAARREASRSERKWTILFALFALAAIATQLFYPDGIDVPRTIEWLGKFLPWN